MQKQHHSVSNANWRAVVIRNSLHIHISDSFVRINSCILLIITRKHLHPNEHFTRQKLSVSLFFYHAKHLYSTSATYRCHCPERIDAAFCIALWDSSKISNSQTLVMIIINKSVCEFDIALLKQVGMNGQQPLHLLVDVNVKRRSMGFFSWW